MKTRDTYIGALNAALAMNGELLETLQALVAVVGELPETDGVTQGRDLHQAAEAGRKCLLALHLPDPSLAVALAVRAASFANLVLNQRYAVKESEIA